MNGSTQGGWYLITAQMYVNEELAETIEGMPADVKSELIKKIQVHMDDRPTIEVKQFRFVPGGRELQSLKDLLAKDSKTVKITRVDDSRFSMMRDLIPRALGFKTDFKIPEEEALPMVYESPEMQQAMQEEYDRIEQVEEIATLGSVIDDFAKQSDTHIVKALEASGATVMKKKGTRIVFVL